MRIDANEKEVQKLCEAYRASTPQIDSLVKSIQDEIDRSRKLEVDKKHEQLLRLKPAEWRVDLAEVSPSTPPMSYNAKQTKRSRGRSRSDHSRNSSMEYTARGANGRDYDGERVRRETEDQRYINRTLSSPTPYSDSYRSVNTNTSSYVQNNNSGRAAYGGRGGQRGGRGGHWNNQRGNRGHQHRENSVSREQPRQVHYGQNQYHPNDQYSHPSSFY